MSLKFEFDGDFIYDPLRLGGTTVTVTVTNEGEDDLSDLGLYITPATNIGDVDYPADYSPETDYQDILAMGTRTVLAIAASGGLKVTLPINGGGTDTNYITRTQGATYGSRLPFIDLASGDSATFDLEIEAGPTPLARRFFVNLCLE